MKYLNSKVLYVSASFLAGFAVMTVELVSARIVAPIIGNSVFTWTSVIGMTLLGLSLGSWLGGRVADKYSGHKYISIAFVVSALLVASIIPMVHIADVVLGFSSSIVLLNILLSGFLFLLPAIAMGTIQPMVLKNYATDFSKLASEYGVLSAVWSLGSILGVFLTGFVFISSMGSSATIFSIAFVLFILSLVFALNEKKLFMYFLGGFIVFVILFTLIGSSRNEPGKSLVYEGESDYYKIRVKDANLSGFGQSRILFLDFDSHSIYPSIVNEDFYPEMYPVFANLKKDIKDIIVIGAGAYTMPEYFAEYYKGAGIDVIEPDPALVDMGHKYFGLSKYNIKTEVGDARYVLPRTDKKYDVVFGDAYNSFISVPWHLMTKEWNEDVKKKLNDGGVYAVNFIGITGGENNGMVNSVVKTFEQTFPNFYVFKFGEGDEAISNIVLVGVNGTLPLSDKELVQKLSKGKNPFLAKKVINKDSLNFASSTNAVILTDDFAPVEKLMQPIMRQYFKDDFALVSGLF